MKKSFLFAATGAMSLMLASCSADEPVAQNTTDGAINYSVVSANQSRAAHSYCANNMPAGFKVWAKHGSVIYIDGDDVEERGGEYIDVTGSRFWPINTTTTATGDYDALSFYAVADGDFGTTSATFNNNTMAVENYTIKDNVADQLDLMYATNIGATYNTSESDAENAVKLNFRHALSQICFKAKNESTTNRITVKKVSICNLNNKGTYTLPSDKSTTDNITDHGTSTTAERTHGSWGSKSGNASYEVTVGGTDGLILNNTAQFLNVSNLAGDHKQTDWSKVFTLLPQDQTSATVTDNTQPSTGAYFKLTLKVENIGLNDTYEPVHDGEFELYLGAEIHWKEGNRYIYTFNFGNDWSPANLKAIEYTVTTDDFIEVDLYPEIEGTEGKYYDAALMREATGSVPALYVATKNIGAASPKDYGLYFWWGDTQGRYYDYTDDFRFSAKETRVTTMNLDLNTEVNKNEWLDATGVKLNLEKDAARKLWGGTWRMPTEEDFLWLIENCTWTEVNDGGKLVGVRVVSKTTGGEIFLPAASCFQVDNAGDGKGFHGRTGKTFYNWCFYWCSTANIGNNQEAYRLGVKMGGERAVREYGWRYDGFPIRAVANTIENPVETTDPTTDPTTDEESPAN